MSDALKINETLYFPRKSRYARNQTPPDCLDLNDRLKNDYCRVDLATGDISKIKANVDGTPFADLLVARAFTNDHLHKEVDSLIGALARNQGISVHKLAKEKEEDLRDTHNCWISKPLSGAAVCRRIMVWEPDRINKQWTVQAVFAAMIAMAKEECQRVIMPILAYGSFLEHQS